MNRVKVVNIMRAAERDKMYKDNHLQLCTCAHPFVQVKYGCAGKISLKDALTWLKWRMCEVPTGDRALRDRVERMSEQP